MAAAAVGIGVYRLSIPAAPSLLGLELYTQGLIPNDARSAEGRFTGFAVNAVR